jgi:hypothetical protein
MRMRRTPHCVLLIVRAFPALARYDDERPASAAAELVEPQAAAG